MTTPTIFSASASNPFQAKGEPQQLTAQQAVVSVPTGTATGAVVGLIRFQAGFSLKDLAIAYDALGTGVTASVGYVYDGTTGESPAAFISAGTTPAAGGSVIWPTAGGLLTGISFTATGPGYIAVTTGGATTGTTGNITAIAGFTYNLGS